MAQTIVDGTASQTRLQHTILLLILVAYVALGCLYAIKTPYWQSPDEPAHYNYVRYVSETGHLPELSPGDYPAQYLEEIKAARFPSEMSISAIRYESHQPPLYYLVAAPIYRLTESISSRPSPLPLRLFSVLLSGIAMMLAYGCMETVLPRSPRIVLGATALVAFVPQHLALGASINSDPMVELLITGTALTILRHRGPWTWGRTILLGAMLGLALLTKMQAYASAGIVGIALLLDHRDENGKVVLRQVILKTLVVAATALVVASPWLVRNMILYGWNDPLSMARHEAVVVGQLTTRTYIAQHGLMSLVQNGLLTTFHSFWGQFGWMGVPMPPRAYNVLAVLSLHALIGFCWWANARLRGWNDQSAHLRRSMLVLLGWAAVPFAGYIWYNAQFVQHQGRYLFPALVPIAMMLVLGLDEMIRERPWGVIALTALGLATVLSRVLWTGDVARFTMGLLMLVAAAMLGLGRAERHLEGISMIVMALALVSFDVICLYQYILPALIP